MDIIIRATMPWDGPEQYDTNHIHHRTCLDCGDPISDRATRCQPCARAFRERVKMDTLFMDRLPLEDQLEKLYRRFPRASE